MTTTTENIQIKRAIIDKTVCVNCGTCVMMFPKYFESSPNGEVQPIPDVQIEPEDEENVKNTCPVGAIKIVK